MPREKGRKIKRYRKIYQRRSPFALLLRWAGVAAAVCLLGFIGWSAYGPVADYLAGLSDDQPVLASSFPEEQPASSAPVPAPEPEPAPEPPKNAMPEQVRAAYLPQAVLLDQARLDSALDSFALAGINAVMFDLKDANGAVLYRSALEQAALARGEDTYAQYDLAALCKSLTSRGFAPIGRLNAFRDTLGAARIPDAGIKYMDSEMLWLDNSPQAGGRAWLNPYSDEARAYLTGLSAEAASMGVACVLLDHFSFPTGYGQEYAGYGPNAVSTPKAQALSEFLAALEQKTAQAGAQLSLYLSGTAALGAQNQYYDGQNPLSLSQAPVTVNLSPAQFGNGFVLGDFAIESPAADPSATALALLRQLAPDLSGRQVVGLVLAGANNYPDPVNAIQGQLDALAQSGVESYILYSQDGVYPTLSGG